MVKAAWRQAARLPPLPRNTSCGQFRVALEQTRYSFLVLALFGLTVIFFADEKGFSDNCLAESLLKIK
jgi:hypothetical protein